MLVIGIAAHAQDESNMSIILLGNDEISDINVSDTFVASISPAINLVEAEFAGVPKDQKIDVYITCHKTGDPTIELRSAPKLDSKREEAFLAKLKALKPENTRLLDVPLLIRINAAEGVADVEDQFLHVKRKAAYEKAGLKQKYLLNKQWATEEVLPVIAAYESIVDDKFAGVKSFGSKVAATNFNGVADVAKLTSNNPDYWRAVMEMSPGNQLIPATKIFALVSQGQLDHAHRYLEMIAFVAAEEPKITGYLNELQWRLRVFDEELGKEVNKGIALHDAGKYKEAVALYQAILKDYPYSAWTLYEEYFSQNTMDMESGKIKTGNWTQWEAAKPKVYAASPMYSMDIRATNGKEAYLLFRRHEISTLFGKDADMLADMFEYAEIASDLGVNDFAAQLYWLTFTYGKDEMKDRSLHRYLYALEKLGVPQWKKSFEGDFDKIFKAIDKERQKAMEASEGYQSFEN